MPLKKIPKVTITMTIEAEVLERFDRNLERLRNEFKETYGFTEKELRRPLSRSSFISEVVDLMAKPWALEMFSDLVAKSLGVNFKQGEMFDDE